VEIQEQAQRAMNEEEFREAVKRIRERKEREHEAELARKKADQQSKTAGERPIP
jgi:BRCT domain type II-containing protein